MKKLAIAMNAVFFILVSAAYLSELSAKMEQTPRERRYGYAPPPKPFKWEEFGFAILLLSLPTVNLIYIARTKSEGEGWLALYFQRRAAEERAKIRAIESNNLPRN